MKRHPLVSVIIPAFNAQDTIARTLASVHAQTYPAFEVIVIDDGSTDATAAIVAGAGHGAIPTRLIRTGNAGAAAARNTGIAASNGALIAPLDSDDLWRPDYLWSQVKALAAAPAETGFVYVLHQVIDFQGRILRSFPDFNCHGYVFHQHLLVNFVGNGSAAVFRREAVSEAGGYDVDSRLWGGGEDYLLQLLIAARRPVAFNSAVLVGYRKRPGSLSSDPACALRSRLAVVERALTGRTAPACLRRWIACDAALAASAQYALARRWRRAARLALQAL
ncbi:MAG TPA: glycosyltransferase family A protein, partial [Caulobacteraceae bacterium]